MGQVIAVDVGVADVEAVDSDVLYPAPIEAVGVEPLAPNAAQLNPPVIREMTSHPVLF